MAKIIEFEPWARRARVAAARCPDTMPEGWSAEIIIFPGVRIERYGINYMPSSAEGRAKH